MSKVKVTDISASGVPSNETYLRGDGNWGTPDTSSSNYNFTGGGVSTASLTKPSIVQLIARRGAGTLALPNLPTEGNTLVLVWTGAYNVWGIPSGWTQQSNSQNLTQGVTVWTKTSDGTGTAVAVTQSDNGTWALYEIASYASLSVAADSAPVNPLSIPASASNLILWTLENDGGWLNVTAGTGYVIDIMGNTGGNHSGAIGHITAEEGTVSIPNNVSGTAIAAIITLVGGGAGGGTLVTIPGVKDEGGDQVKSFKAGSNITLTNSGGVLTITSTGGGGAALTISDASGDVATSVTKIKFTGTAVTSITNPATGEVDIELDSGGGGGGSSLTVSDGTTTVTDVATLSFSGATVSGAGGDALVTVEGGSGGSTGGSTHFWGFLAAGVMTPPAVVATATGAYTGNPQSSLTPTPINDFYWGNSTGQTLTFDFGTSVSISGFGFVQDNASAQGNWQVSVSDDGTNFVNRGTPFAWGGARVSYGTFPNVTPHRYYRLTQVSGTTSSSPYQQQILARWNLAAGSAGGALRLIQDLDVTGLANVDFLGFSSQYLGYEFELVDLHSTTDNDPMWMRCSTDGGATFDSSGVYDYATPLWGSGGYTANVNGNNQSNLPFSGGLSTTAGYVKAGTIQLGNASSTTGFKQFSFLTSVGASDGNNYLMPGAGRYKSLSPVTGIRFGLNSGGTFASGRIRVWGRVKSQNPSDWAFNPPKSSDFPTVIGTVALTSVTDDDDIGMSVVMPASHSGMMGRTKAIDPTKSWTATMRFKAAMLNPATANVGIILSNGTQGWMVGYDSRSQGGSFHAMKYSTSGYDGWEWLLAINAAPRWCRMVYDHTADSISFGFSADGKNWVMVSTMTSVSSYLTGSTWYLGMGGCTESYGNILPFSVDHWDDTL